MSDLTTDERKRVEENERQMVARPPKKPEEYILDCLQMMPVAAGTGAVTHPAVLKGWAKHLVETGVAHRDYLETLADEDGNIHISKLPKQRKKLAAPMRGPRHGWNNARRWVDINSKETKPPVVQDPRLMTAQEREAQLSIYAQMGLIPERVPQRDVAVVIQ